MKIVERPKASEGSIFFQVTLLSSNATGMVHKDSINLLTSVHVTIIDIQLLVEYDPTKATASSQQAQQKKSDTQVETQQAKIAALPKRVIDPNDPEAVKYQFKNLAKEKMLVRTTRRKGGQITDFEQRFSFEPVIYPTKLSLLCIDSSGGFTHHIDRGVLKTCGCHVH